LHRRNKQDMKRERSLLSAISNQEMINTISCESLPDGETGKTVTWARKFFSSLVSQKNFEHMNTIMKHSNQRLFSLQGQEIRFSSEEKLYPDESIWEIHIE
jgi:hypothetical protein